MDLLGKIRSTISYSNIRHFILSALFIFAIQQNASAIEKNADGKYVIKTAQDWQELRSLCSKSAYLEVELNADIEIDGTIPSIGLGGVAPVGGWTGSGARWNQKTDMPFVGNFNGNGKTITIILPTNGSFSTTNNTTAYFGLFGVVGDASAKQTKIEKLKVKYKVPKSRAYSTLAGFGALVGDARNTKIDDCTVTEVNFETSTALICGGIAGRINNCEITNSKVEGSNTLKLTSTNISGNQLGGICGSATNSTIINCHVRGVNKELTGVKLLSLCASGIAASVTGCTIKECSAAATLGQDNKNLNASGGLCGEVFGITTIYNCYARFALSKVQKINNYGNLVGKLTYNEAAGGTTLTMKNCYAAGSGAIISSSSYGTAIGNLGNNTTANLESCYVQTDIISGITGKDGVAADEEKDAEFMKSGCFAEYLNKYAKENFTLNDVSVSNLWLEDKEGKNDLYPVLSGQVEDKYKNEVPFCHPNIFTYDNAPVITDPSVNKKTTLSGEIKYISESQKRENWVYGFVVTEGSKTYFKSTLGNLNETPDANGNVKFSYDYTISGTSTVTYRAFVQDVNGKEATGEEKQIYFKINKDETIEGCDSVIYDGKKYFEPTSFKNDAGNTITIIVNHSDSTDISNSTSNNFIKNCSYWEYLSNQYWEEGHYIIPSSVTTTPKGCRKFSYINVTGLGDKPQTIDSVAILTLDNVDKPYVYNTIKQPGTKYTASIGNSWVVTPSSLKGTIAWKKDAIPYSDPSKENCYGKDSITINSIKYLSPVKINPTPIVTERCGAGYVTLYNGESIYIKEDMTVTDVKVYGESEITDLVGIDYDPSITQLYEVVTYNYKVNTGSDVPISSTEKIHADKYAYQIDETTHTLCNTATTSCDLTDKDYTYYIASKGGKNEYYYTLEDAKATCPTKITEELHTVCSTTTVDSLVVLTIDNITTPYVYTSSTGKQTTLKVTNEWVYNKTSLVSSKDAFKYKAKKTCVNTDSLVVNSVKYLSPVKATIINETPALCDTSVVTVGGKTYTISENTTINEVKTYTGAEIATALNGKTYDPAITTLYEVVSHNFTVKSKDIKPTNTTVLQKTPYAYEIDENHHLCTGASCKTTDKDVVFYIVTTATDKLYYSTLAEAQENCPAKITAELNTYCSYKEVDSVYVLTMDNIEKDYVYKMNTALAVVGLAEYSVKVGKTWQSVAKDMPTAPVGLTDRIKHKNGKEGCNGTDSIYIKSIKYLSPIKISSALQTEKQCGAGTVTVGGKDYYITKDTTINEVKAYHRSEVTQTVDKRLDSLYEIIPHPYKVINTKVVDEVKGWKKPFVYEINESSHTLCTNPPFNPNGCKTTTDETVFYVVTDAFGINRYYYTYDEAMVGCPEKITRETHKICLDFEKTIDTTVCGEFVVPENPSMKYTSSKNDIKVLFSDKLPEDSSCTKLGYYIYNVVVNPRPEATEKTLHGCGSITFTSLNGNNVTLTPAIMGKTKGVYADVKKGDASIGECDLVQNINYTLHPIPTPIRFDVTGCDSASYTYLNNQTVYFKRDTTFRDIKKVSCDHGCDCDEIIRDVVVTVYGNEVKETLNLKGCDSYTYAKGTAYERTFTESASFIDERTLDFPDGTQCSSIQPVNLTMFKSTHTSKDVTIFDKFTAEDGWTTTVDAIHKVTLPDDENGCVNTITYNVKIAKTEVLSDTTIYGCESVAYKKLNGTSVTYTESIEFIDVLPSAVAEGDAARRKVTISIEYPKYVEKAQEPACGFTEIYLKRLDKKITVTETSYIKDTVVTAHGCKDVTTYYVPIIPVRTIHDTVVACKYYTSAPDMPDNIGTTKKVYVLTTGNEASIKTADLQFRLDREDSDVCKDDSFLHVEVHGVLETNLRDLKACDAYDYVKMNGKIIPLTETTLVRDTLKSATCDCDSVIQNVNVVVNHSSPYDPTTVDTFLSRCDSVVYYSPLRIKKLVFYNDDTFTDTLENQFGCDSIINGVVKIKHSVIQDEYVNACRETELTISTLDTTLNMTVYRTDTYRSLIKKTDDGCDNAIDYHVTITNPEPIALPEKHCGDTIINRRKYRTGEHIIGFGLATEKCMPDTVHMLYVYPTYSKDTTIIGCDVVTYNGTGYTENTSLKYNFPTAIGGCDSIINVNIVVNHRSPIDNTVHDYGTIGCDSVVYERGTKRLVFKETKIFADTLENASGCDSVVNYKANVFKTGSTVVKLYAYRDTILNINQGNGKEDVTITQSRTYKDIIEALDNGCYRGTDYDVTIITPDTLFLDGPTGCGSVAYNGKTYSVSVNGVQKVFKEINVRNPQNKASRDTVTKITVYPTYNRTETVQGCGTAEYGDNVFDVSQTYTYPTFTTAVGGCDSIVTLNITVGENTEAPYGEFAVHGCDSAVYMRGEKRLVFTEPITVIKDTIRNASGCDSIIYRRITVSKSESIVIDIPAVCRETYLDLHDELGVLKRQRITESGIYKDTLSKTPEGCFRGIDYKVTITTPDTLEIDTTACGNIKIGDLTYDSGVENVNRFELKIGHNPADNCSPDTLYKLSVYPTYFENKIVDGCNDYTFDGDTYTASGLYTLTYKTVKGGCDSIIALQVNLHPVSDELYTVRSSYLRSEYKKDTVVVRPMVSEYDCEYNNITTYTVIPPKIEEEDVFVCQDYLTGMATFRGIEILEDTVIVDSLYGTYDLYAAMLGDTLGVDTLRSIYVHINLPDTGDVHIDSCIQVTYNGIVYTDSTDLYELSPLKTMEGCDSILHIHINVGKCFPYPILVNKYDWILICNDNIMSEDRFRKYDGVKYRWYKDSTLITETTENYYTESQALKGRYYVGVVTASGDIYYSDEVTVYGENTITLSPNPVEKGKPITIECELKDDAIMENDKFEAVEVYNAIGIKQRLDNLQISVYDNVSTIVISTGMPAAGHYFVRLTSEGGMKYTAKFIVK